MLIVEGPDRIGKSTLCALIAKHMSNACLGRPFTRGHHTRPGPDWLPMKWYPENVQKYKVQDRFHMSEAVYGELIRYGSLISADEYGAIDEVVEAKNGMIVLMFAEPDEYDKILTSRDCSKEWLTQDEMRKVNQAYHYIGTSGTMGIRGELVAPLVSTTVMIKSTVTVTQLNKAARKIAAEYTKRQQKKG